jgi:condensin complex subunit 2
MAVDAVRRDNVMGSEALPSGADYDMWIKMAADNKINAKNSWNLALIDYFYDLSFQPVTNFQKMSAILDGCIKIYSSRVDSAVNETGTLLSGLSSNEHLKSALSFTADQLLGANSGEDSSDIEVSQAAKVYRRRNIRENTLAKSCNELKVKNLEKELVVDPVFKKTLSYLMEGDLKVCC